MDIPVLSLGEYTTLLAALFIAVVSTGRMARLLAHDHMPLIADFRDWWVTHTSPRWALLMTCHYCIAVYLGFANAIWGYWSDLHVTWWLFNISLFLAYLGAMVVTHDGDNSEL